MQGIMASALLQSIVLTSRVLADSPKPSRLSGAAALLSLYAVSDILDIFRQTADRANAAGPMALGLQFPRSRNASNVESSCAAPRLARWCEVKLLINFPIYPTSDTLTSARTRGRHRKRGSGNPFFRHCGHTQRCPHHLSTIIPLATGRGYSR